METERIFFENGIYEQVLEEILVAQRKKPTEIFYIQPYSDRIISEFKKLTPSTYNKWLLYATTTNDLSNVLYTAEIVHWEYKPDIPAERLQLLNAFIAEFQPGERCIYPTQNGKTCANLISIRNLRKLYNPIPVNRFYKISDGTPLKARKRAGNWSYVVLMNENSDDDYILQSYLDADLAKRTNESGLLSQEARIARLRSIEKRFPSKINVVSHAYKRNPDVVAEALFRANGKCSLCHKDAPFCKPDGTPYLEVHHWTSLADGGEDTIDNAAALCPNCHKEAHYGTNSKIIQEEQTHSV